MFNWLRVIVAGSKNRLMQGEYNLDLTYIQQRIIAMAFPASGCEQIYRNRMQDVSKYVQEKHKDKYYVINVSNRPYDQEPFGGRVKSYEWNDHQAPRLTILLQICQFVVRFLKQDPQNVVLFHCNHGKGRTGTAIMAYLLMTSGESVETVMLFYNKKRFLNDKYKVDQPCQVRYLNFFKLVLDHPQKYQKQRVYTLKQISCDGLQADKYYLNITSVRSGKILFDKIDVGGQIKEVKKQMISSDIFIQIMKKGCLVDHRISRINFNLQFLTQQEKVSFLELKATQIVIQKCHHKKFTLKLVFDVFCGCHEAENSECPCLLERRIEQQQWKLLGMYNGIKIEQKEISLQMPSNKNLYDKN